MAEDEKDKKLSVDDLAVEYPYGNPRAGVGPAESAAVSESAGSTQSAPPQVYQHSDHGMTVPRVERPALRSYAPRDADVLYDAKANLPVNPTSQVRAQIGDVHVPANSIVRGSRDGNIPVVREPPAVYDEASEKAYASRGRSRKV